MCDLSVVKEFPQTMRFKTRAPLFNGEHGAC
jgi:hypothetical protein